MVKVQMKSEKLTPFGGIISIMELSSQQASATLRIMFVELFHWR